MSRVQVEWTDHPPSHVPVNVFTEHGLNTKAWETVQEYAKDNNLTNTSGWKQFKPTRDQANNVTKHRLNKPSREFFQSCFYAHHSAHKAVHPDTGKLVEYPALLKSSDAEHWEQATCEEIGRLAQGFPPSVPEGTDTMHFIRFDDIPSGRKATFLRLVVADRPMKANPRRVRFTVGGDKVDYPHMMCLQKLMTL